MTAVLLGATVPACGDSSAKDCTPGSVGCECATGGQCFAGLQCLSNFCVDAPGTASASASASNTNDPDTSGEPTSTSTPTSDGPDSEGHEAGGPQILQFLTNVNTITEAESVTFTAVVTDPDGVADVIGGSLTSPDGSISFGAFATSGEEGAYSLALSWSQIHQADSIEFESPSIVRTFRAEFFDQSGKSAWKTVDITLSCDDGVRITPASCDAVCTDLDSDDLNCSHCAIECKVWKESSDVGRCINSACSPTYYGCVNFMEFVNCNETCAAEGEACVVGGCEGQTSIDSSGSCSSNSSGNGAHACTDDPSSTNTSCCCTQTI
ncbi:hypothetical protein [Nannocystis pusilla]|uniref:Uncharacterized protein n=1 Tax=Nannocystis pusilla TaxID=889268 RepID=A0ABS7TV59_9BACT|nr:hypothetical protein [Nannocystis pusilla]MBZ5711931.1 hypothetical protein [Nannocystis pusilla]